ncbi:RHS repeat-associated core domain-containing protein, partial [Azoarcus sp. L1K30]|uniref:RHS repeat-associated core domain-containing protein n=1 Tax=Azoarcus sp. L1K30 TaxID=2820277 RepID=UPI001B82BCA8
HDNWHRTYDPRTGRYLQPDPMGYPDGPDAYLYASGDPVNRGDPMGLYAIDVHYYMTYFLALVAGIDQRQAWVIATAAQTIDDVNPYTDAMPFKGAGWAYEQRQKYHFTQDGFDPPASANDVHEEIVGYTQIGMPIFESTYSPEYQLRRLKAWNNPQVRLLHDYAIKAGDDYGPCMKGQFYGEYLHALADVFGHRDANNDPYGAVAGHWYNGTDPDMTYNHGRWQLNEQRTLEMERTMFKQFQRDFGREATDKEGVPIQFTDIEGFLVGWNQEVNEEEKIVLLQRKIKNLGLEGLTERYDKYLGLACRIKYLRNAFLINDLGRVTKDGRALYPGAILDTEISGNETCTY